jgi:hypothetical protein
MPLCHFLVEQYIPQLDPPSATAHARRLHEASTQLHQSGVAIRWVRAIALPDEENLLCFIDAHRIEHIRQATERAGATNLHVQQVIAIDPGRAAVTGALRPRASSP